MIKYSFEELKEIFPSGKYHRLFSDFQTHSDGSNNCLWYTDNYSLLGGSGYFHLTICSKLSVGYIEKYFQDPINPTEDEHILFMIEHNFNYKAMIESHKRGEPYEE